MGTNNDIVERVKQYYQPLHFFIVQVLLHAETTLSKAELHSQKSNLLEEPTTLKQLLRNSGSFQSSSNVDVLLVAWFMTCLRERKQSFIIDVEKQYHL